MLIFERFTAETPRKIFSYIFFILFQSLRLGGEKVFVSM